MTTLSNNVGAIINTGSTALHHAAENGHEAIVRLLLNKGVDVTVKDTDGREGEGLGSSPNMCWIESAVLVM